MPSVLEFLVIAASVLNVIAYGPVVLTNTTHFCVDGQATSAGDNSALLAAFGTYSLTNSIWAGKTDNTDPTGFQCTVSVFLFVSSFGNSSICRISTVGVESQSHLR